jgi:hypothetical protein
MATCDDDDQKSRSSSIKIIKIVYRAALLATIAAQATVAGYLAGFGLIPEEMLDYYEEHKVQWELIQAEADVD